MKFDRQLLSNFDWSLLAFVLLICFVGILNIYSAGFSLMASGKTALYVKQLQWIAVGLIFMMVSFSIDYRIINRYAYFIYSISLFLLVLVFVYGYTAHGSQRWIVWGGFSFQPSELMKLTIILALARYFDNHKIKKEGCQLKELVAPFFIVFVPFLFILKQPDLGTALILLLIFVSIVFFVGIQWKSLLLAIAGTIIMVPLAWHFLKDYQKERILTLFDPEKDPLGAGYHILQSIIAVGSGGVLGKGFLKGTQTQLKFLPVQQTDFVFSVFAEEWGFLGGVLLIIGFLALILWGLKISLHSRDLVGTIISFGVTMLIFWEVFINIGMVLGILPVVGIPLPFLSYGGSSIIVLMLGMGLLMNISTRRFLLKP
jgi:rod shape determining protein RodA